MFLKRTMLRDAIVLALCVGSGTVLAQEAAAPGPAATAADQATRLDRIEVTGSRIVIPGLTTSSPVTSVERAEINRTQPVAVEDIVKLLPSAVPAIGPGTNNDSGGGATLDLRGLGPQRTLVLLDGRRVVPFDLNGVVDTNIIPISLIERVELVTGGASAVYGADAISGVVNFILRRDFEGAEVSSSWGQSIHGDGDRLRTDVTVGANFDDGRGNVVLSVGHTDTEEVLQGDREFGVFALDSEDGTRSGSNTTVPSAIFGPNSLGGQINPTTGVIDPDIAAFNFNPDNFYQTPLDRYQATALARYEVTEEVEAYTQLLYTRSDVSTQLASSGTFLDVFTVPVGNAFIPEPARQQICADHNAAAALDSSLTPISNCAAGSAELVDLTIGRRFEELGPRGDDFSTKTLQVTVGLRGDLGDYWHWDTYWSHGESDQTQVLDNWGSLSKVQQALLSVDGVTCLDPSGGCVPLNIWGPDGSITQEMLDFINLDAFQTQSVRQDVYSASVNGDLGENFKSPWADYPIGLAFGYEHRKTEASTANDAASQVGDVLGTGGPAVNVSGSFKLEEVYAELLLPILSDKPGAHALNFEAGYRYSKFDVAGGTSTDYGSWKAGLDWSPIESLRFRAMLQRATRAPNVNELFSPAVTDLDNLAFDPCQEGNINQAEANTPGTLSNLCLLTGVPLARIGNLPEPSASQVNVLTSGSPELEPEKADTQTIGLVWQPSFVQDLVITLDYWKIEMEDVISFFPVDDVINGCYDPALNPGLTFNSFCALIGRNPANGTFSGSGSPGIGQLLTNFGAIETDGFDLGVRYGFNLAEAWGRLDFALDATKVNSSKFQASPVSANRECVGFYSVACGNNSLGGFTYEYKWNQRTVWTIKPFEASLTWRHTSSLEEEPGGTVFLPEFSKIDAYDYLDLGLAWNSPWGARISLTVNNLTDKQPPIVGNTIAGTSENSGNTFPQNYDVIGRFYTLGIDWKF